jgi:hypothetical protein
MAFEKDFQIEKLNEMSSDILPKSKDIRTKFGYERVVRNSARQS